MKVKQLIDSFLRIREDTIVTIYNEEDEVIFNDMYTKMDNVILNLYFRLFNWYETLDKLTIFM